MANFRKPKQSKTAMRPVLNHEGAVAHELNDLEVLFSQTLGSFFGESTFYEERSAETAFVDLYERISRVPQKDKEYVLKLSKGLSKSRDVTLADVINLCHPRPRNKEYEQFFKDILGGNIKVGNDKVTLNTALTQKGQAATDDNAQIITAVKTENLQNIVKNLVALYRAGAFDESTLESVCARLRDANEVSKSKLLPFRFISAYSALDANFRNRDASIEKLKSSLAAALNLAAANVPTVEGRTCVLVDVSGSMHSPISQKSSETAARVAGVFGRDSIQAQRRRRFVCVRYIIREGRNF